MTVIVAGLSTIITGIAALIPAVAEKLGEAIIAFCGVIAQGAPAIGEAVKAVVLTLVDVLVECVPAIADGALALLSGVLASLANYTPEIVDSIMLFLINLLNGIAAVSYTHLDVYKRQKRTTDPQTIYITDSMHRDDIIDITDFDVVEYQYGVMRQTLLEEVATRCV